MADTEDMAMLYDVGLPAMNDRIRKIYADSESEKV